MGRWVMGQIGQQNLHRSHGSWFIVSYFLTSLMNRLLRCFHLLGFIVT